jgi:hypothetical protein
MSPDENDNSNGDRDNDEDETRSLTATKQQQKIQTSSHAGVGNFYSAAQAHDAASSSLEIDVEHDYQNDDILDSDDDEGDDEEGLGFLYPSRFISSSSSSLRYKALPRSRRLGVVRSNGRGLARRSTVSTLLVRFGIPPAVISYLPLIAGATLVGIVLVVAVLYKPSRSRQDDLWAVGNHNHGHGAGTSGSGELVCHAVANANANATTHTAADDQLEHFLERIDRLPQKERCVVRPGQRGCPCQGSSLPAMPNEGPWNASWQIAYDRNQQLAQKELEQNEPQQQTGYRPLDLIMVGDSITESVRFTSISNLFGRVFLLSSHTNHSSG